MKKILKKIGLIALCLILVTVSVVGVRALLSVNSPKQTTGRTVTVQRIGTTLYVNGDPVEDFDLDAFMAEQQSFPLQAVEGKDSVLLHTTSPERENTVTADYSASFGSRNTVTAEEAFATGGKNTASGNDSLAAGYTTVASGENSFTTGYKSVASGENSFAIGGQTEAAGKRSVAEGNKTYAGGKNSHAEGNVTTATGENSHAAGDHTVAEGDNQFVVGKYNDFNEDAIFIVGNGENEGDLQNAFEVGYDDDADDYFITVGSTVVTETQLIALLALLNTP